MLCPSSGCFGGLSIYPCKNPTLMALNSYTPEPINSSHVRSCGFQLKAFELVTFMQASITDCMAACDSQKSHKSYTIPTLVILSSRSVAPSLLIVSYAIQHIATHAVWSMHNNYKLSKVFSCASRPSKSGQYCCSHLQRHNRS